MGYGRYSVYIKGQPYVVRDGLEYTKRNVVAFEDRVVVEGYADEFFGGEESRPYRSRMMDRPTWGQLFRVAESQIKRTRDHHHVFLEGARVVRREVDKDGRSYAVVQLTLGS